MASLSGVSSSNTVSSLMNSANMISGLASGLDTESMIESLVQSYQKKITQLNQKVTKVEWKQDAYRSIISQMVGFANRYTSYTSSTNLMSRSFFSNAVKVATLGKYADAVSASGKSTSNVSLNAVHQLATAAQYRTTSNLTAGDGKSIEASAGVDLNGTTTLGSLNGGLTLTYGNEKVTISFDQVSDVKAMEQIRSKLGSRASDADVLAELINQKLEGQTITLTGGKSVAASDRIKVEVRNGTISLSDKSTAGNSVYVSGTSGNVCTILGIDEEMEDVEKNKDKLKSFNVPKSLTEEVDNMEYLSGKSLNMSLDGVGKNITLPTIINGRILDSDGNLIKYNAENYTKVLNDAVQAAYKGKVKVSNVGEGGKLQLRFDVQEGSNLIINTSVGETLGIGRSATSYMNTSKTLGELLGEDKLDALTPAVDKNGKALLDKDGNEMYSFVINGVKVGNYSKNSTLAELMSDINSSNADVSVSYSQTTKKFLFQSKSTGADSQIKLGGGLATAMFGETHGDMKVTGLVDMSDITKEFSFSIDGEQFSGKFESNAGSMKDLLNQLNNKVLKDSGYTASYSVREGLVIKDAEGNVKTVDYDDADNNILKKITDGSKQDIVDHTTDKLSDIIGASVKGESISFSIGDHTYDYEFIGNGVTMETLVKKLNSIMKDDGYKASYSDDRGLVITDRNGKEVDVEYGDDVLAKVVKAVGVHDYSEAKLTGVAGGDIVNAKEFQFTVNGKTYTGKIDSSNATMDELLGDINWAMRNTGYTASYSSVTGELVVTDYQGKEVEVEYGADGLLSEIMGAYEGTFKTGKDDSIYTKGQDAIFDVTINGEKMQMTRSSNSVDIDGLTVTMKETFNSTVDENGKPVKGEDGKYQVEDAKESVTFKTSTDSDKIVDAIKTMIEDYNTMMAEIKSAYMTMPYQKSSGSFANYEPLTDEEMEGMSESAIARYEEKAKQGILFGDRTLSTLYTKMNQAFSFNNKADVDTLKAMGITVSYSASDGVQAVTLDEEKLRAMLDSDPDRVANLFTKTDGVMDRMKTQLDNYAKTTGEPKGILIQQAGSPLSSLSLMNNNWQKEIDNYTKQIERWQNKLQSQVERYTSQFARLEQLINQMNSQSSTLAGFMGGS